MIVGETASGKLRMPGSRLGRSAHRIRGKDAIMTGMDFRVLPVSRMVLSVSWEDAKAVAQQTARGGNQKPVMAIMSQLAERAGECILVHGVLQPHGTFDIRISTSLSRGCCSAVGLISWRSRLAITGR